MLSNHFFRIGITHHVYILRIPQALWACIVSGLLEWLEWLYRTPAIMHTTLLKFFMC